MDSYFEIKAIPDPELLQSAVIGQLMQAVHSYLPRHEGRIGISFPAYGQARTLGGILRLHGEHGDLAQLHLSLQNTPSVSSYGLITDVKPVPNKLRGNIRFKRRHTKGYSHFKRLEQRNHAKGNWTPEHQAAVAAKYSESIKCPHVALRSHSTGQGKFLLFIEREMLPAKIEGIFNNYGLSKTATVPWF